MLSRVFCLLGIVVMAITICAAADSHTNTLDDEILILDINSSSEMSNGPTQATVLDLSEKTYITKIATYHWNDGSGTSSPGMITIIDLNEKESEGTEKTYEFSASGHDGKDGVPNVYWIIEPDLDLMPGRYEIQDSDSATWSYNEETDGVGVTKVWGITKKNQ